ncbi:arylsulfatase [Nocardioides alcanivorans]|uniref:arylsulfatase n=1 Tax=Nocardioides alcanivorans TaxID=2897352 RepID=UPI001F1FC9C7|nr:arylsulfatase [Nocardioides alcanivorans]
MDRTTLPIRIEQPDVEAAFDIRQQATPFAAPEPVRAPEGAPNVLVILLDDMGFGASSPFGGPCPMPVAEQLAENGLRFNRFHTTALCSPTRAALLTGRNHHSVGMGVVTDFSSSAPGYTGIRPQDAAPLARTLRENGYATGAFGKWHQIPQSDITPVGPFTHWPTNEGFEKFYGIIGGADDQFHPTLFEGTNQIEPPATADEGYHLSEDMVDQAKNWIRQVRTVDATKPWFTYLAFGATHSPFQVPDSWLDRYRGKFSHGWDEQRERTLARQKELGVVPEETLLTQWPEGVPHWDDLTDAGRAVAERLMEIYASFAEHTDAQVGRLVDALRESGELDNTMIFYILGDNGASCEGRLSGTFNEKRTYNAVPETAEEILPRIDQIGTRFSNSNYPVGWALAMDTPFQWTKQVASHFGGTRNGMVVHWPAGIKDNGALRNHWHHVIDVAPTVLEAAGIPQPVQVDGIRQKPIEGTSMLAALADGAAPENHTTQYFEMFGNRGIYHEGWTAVVKHRTPWELTSTAPIPFEDDRWELYDIRDDFSQATDLAATHPEKLAELQELFLAEARKHQVLPLDDRGNERMNPVTAGRRRNDVPTTVVVPPSTRRLPHGAFPSTVNRSFTFTVPVVADSDASDGVLVCIGTGHDGSALYVREGIVSLALNFCGVKTTHVRAERPLSAGEHVIVHRFDSDASGVGTGGVARLFVDGVEVASGRIERTAVFGQGKLSIGAQPGIPITDDYARGGEYAYTGKIGEVVLATGDDVVEPSAQQELERELIEH